MITREEKGLEVQVDTDSGEAVRRGARSPETSGKGAEHVPLSRPKEPVFPKSPPSIPYKTIGLLGL